MKAICASENFDLFVVLPRPTGQAAKLEFFSKDRSEKREADHRGDGHATKQAFSRSDHQRAEENAAGLSAPELCRKTTRGDPRNEGKSRSSHRQSGRGSPGPHRHHNWVKTERAARLPSSHRNLAVFSGTIYIAEKFIRAVSEAGITTSGM
jgi:hypothetical protein